MKKVALITGVSSEIGLAIAAQLTELGYKVYGGARTHVGKFPFTSVKLDVTKDVECSRAVETILTREARLDVLINLAGFTLDGATTSFSSADFIKLLDVNAVGPLRLIKEVVPVMQRIGGGRIINISSLYGLVAFPKFGLYCASKFAVSALSEALYYELKKANIYVVNIAPSGIKLQQPKTGTKNEVKGLRKNMPVINWLMPLVTPKGLAVEIAAVIKMTNPPAQILVGREAVLTYLMHKYLPAFAWQTLVSYILKGR